MEIVSIDDSERCSINFNPFLCKWKFFIAKPHAYKMDSLIHFPREKGKQID